VRKPRRKSKKGKKGKKTKLVFAMETEQALGHSIVEDADPQNNSIQDNRPEISQYTEPALTFLIGPNRKSYTVPQFLARQCLDWLSQPSAFSTYSTYSAFGTTKRLVVELPEVDEDIGHTLVHFLYTGTYQTLKPQGSQGPPESSTEYRRALLAYCTARLYKLDGFIDHAIKTIELFDKDLLISQILAITSDVYPKFLKDEIWFPDYLKSKIQAAFKADETIFAQEQFLSHIGKGTAFTKALVTIMVGIYMEKITNMVETCKVTAEESIVHLSPSQSAEEPHVEKLTAQESGSCINFTASSPHSDGSWDILTMSRKHKPACEDGTKDEEISFLR